VYWVYLGTRPVYVSIYHLGCVLVSSWCLLAGLRFLASAGQDGSLCLFVLQLGLCIGLACGAWLFVALRGPAAPRLPSAF
jgi:hypothetical protein